MPIGGKDAFLSKVTFRRESKWYSKTKQELKNMETKTIGERAIKYAYTECDFDFVEDAMNAYETGATEQKAIDIDKACEWIRNNWRNYVYQDRDGIFHFGHWESAFRKAMSLEE